MAGVRLSPNCVCKSGDGGEQGAEPGPGTEGRQGREEEDAAADVRISGDGESRGQSQEVEDAAVDVRISRS